MARKSSKKSTVAESSTRKGKKKLEEASLRSRRAQDLKEAKLKNPRLRQDSSSSDDIDEDYAEFLKTYRPKECYPPVVVPQDSSSSDDVDEDYAEFLRTYNPREFYYNGYTSEEEGGSQITVEPTTKIAKSPGAHPPK
jgi:hypothetical protein